MAQETEMVDYLSSIDTGVHSILEMLERKLDRINGRLGDIENAIGHVEAMASGVDSNTSQALDQLRKIA